MATTPAPAAPAMSAISRIFGALFNPKPTFADVAARPGWVVPLAVLMVVWFALNVVLAKRVDWVAVTRQQTEQNAFAARQLERLPPEQREQAMESGARRAPIVRYVRGVIGWPLVLVIFGGIYLLVFKLIGGARVDYKTTLAILGHAYVPQALRELLGIPVAFLKDPAAIDPENFLASNLAAVLSPTAPLWQKALGAGLDVFGIWSLVLVAVGFSAADPKNVSFGKALGLVIGLFLVILLFFTGLAAFFS